MDYSIKIWNKMSCKYDQQVKYKYTQAYKATIEKTYNYFKTTDKILDYGCGTGITTIELAEFVKEIIAIDTSKSMIDIAKEKTNIEKINNIKYNTSDIFDESLDANSFDAILGFNILYFIKNIDETLNRIFDILKPNGFFISVTGVMIKEG